MNKTELNSIMNEEIFPRAFDLLYAFAQIKFLHNLTHNDDFIIRKEIDYFWSNYNYFLRLFEGKLSELFSGRIQSYLRDVKELTDGSEYLSKQDIDKFLERLTKLSSSKKEIKSYLDIWHDNNKAYYDDRKKTFVNDELDGIEREFPLDRPDKFIVTNPTKVEFKNKDSYFPFKEMESFANATEGIILKLKAFLSNGEDHTDLQHCLPKEFETKFNKFKRYSYEKISAR